MKPENKLALKKGVFSGVLFSAANSAWNYYCTDQFDVIKFFVLAFIYGVSVGLFSRYEYLKEMKKEGK